MSKGLLFTAMTFLLVFSVVGLATVFSEVNLNTKGDVNVITSADKLAYAYESIKSRLPEAAGVKVYKNEVNVTFNDTIPRNTPIVQFLNQYGDFVEEKFEDPTLRVEFVDSSGNIIDWSVVDDITISPFNITYVYPNTGKNSLEIRFINETELSHLERVELYVRANGVLLQNATGWNPQHDCATPSPNNVPPDCLPFRAIVTDVTGVNQWDSGERNFKMDQQSAVQHSIGTGWVRITVGHSGGDDRILQVEISNAAAETSVRLIFDTDAFSVSNDPARVRVYDTLTYIETEL